MTSLCHNRPGRAAVLSAFMMVMHGSCATAPRSARSAAPREEASAASSEKIAPLVPVPSPPVVSASSTFWQDRQDLLTLPVAPPSATWSWPKEETFVLPNGLTTHLVQKTDETLATAILTLPAGEDTEPRASRGAASLLAGWLRGGTSRSDARPIELRVEEVNASLSIKADRRGLSIACTSMQPTLSECVRLLADLAQAPAFAPESLLGARAQLADHARQLLASPQGRAQAHLFNLLFDQHPAGRALLPADLGALDEGELRAFWATWFRPNAAHLVVAGNVTRAELQHSVTQAFGSWARGSVPKFTAPTQGPEGLRVVLVDDPRLSEATVMFGQRIKVRSAQERAALEALVFIFGGAGTGSRLALDVATRGLIAAGGATLDDGPAGLVLRGTLQTLPSKVWPALLAAAQQLKDLAEQGLTPAELAEAKARSAALDPFALETGAGLATAMATGEQKSLRALAASAVQVDQLTPKVLKPAGRTLHPERLAIVIVGPANQIAPQLQQAKVRFEQVSLEDPISFDERAKRKQLAAPGSSSEPATRAELLAAKTLIIKGLAAQGGAPAWRALKSLKVVKQGQRREGAGVAEVVSTTYYQRPDKVRVEQMASRAGKSSKGVFVLTSEGVWGGEGSKPLTALPPDNVARLRDAIFEDVTFLLLNLLDVKPPLPMQVVPPLQEGQLAYPGVLVRLPSGQWLKLYFDPNTQLLARISAADSAGGETEQRLSDWRAVDGLMFPFKQASVGANPSEATLREVQVNPPIDPALFR